MPMLQTVDVRLGTGRVSLTVPDTTTVLRTPEVPALDDPTQCVCDALADPIGTPSLAEIAKATRPASVAITISDITRPVPNQIILPPILEVLNQMGVRDEQAVIIIATGMHRPSTQAEREHMLGRELLQRCEVVDHRAEEASSAVQVADNPRVAVNRRFVEADLKIVTGLIEPHFMAGYSGGRKGICPGLTDLATVQRFHGYPIMADPNADCGVLDGNPCHAEGLRVARRVGCDFLVNVAITHDRNLAGVYCGDLELAHLAGCQDVRNWTLVQVAEPYDLVITTGGGYPLDATYYQTVKGMVGALPAVHENSTLVVLSSCHEGVGSPEYAQLVRRWGADWRRFLDALSRSNETLKDQWQHQMQTRALRKVGVENTRLVCDGLPQADQSQLGVTPIVGDGDAIRRCQQFIDVYLASHPSSRVAILPEGPYTMLTAVDGGP